MSEPPLLELRAIGVRFARRWVLDAVSLAVDSGERVAVVGDNGTGKSTLLAVAAGVLAPDRGAALLAGLPLRRMRHQLGYVPEAADPPPHLTGAELIDLSAALRGGGPRDHALERRLVPAAVLGARLGSMSLGERRRTCLAAALAGAPRLLVLDEPDNGLDAAGLDLLAELLAAHAAAGGGALIASHDTALMSRLAVRRVTLAAGAQG